MKHGSDPCFLNRRRPQQNLIMPTTDLNAGHPTDYHWKPNQFKFRIKVVFLSPDELAMVKRNESYYLFYKSRDREQSPPSLPASPAYYTNVCAIWVFHAK